MSGASSSPRAAAIASVSPSNSASSAGTRVIDLSRRGDEPPSCDAVVVVLPAGVSWDGEPVAAAGGRWRDEIGLGPRRLRAVPEDAARRRRARRRAAARDARAVRRGDRPRCRRAPTPRFPAYRSTDTLKRVEGERVVDTVDRGQLVAVQTPQAFRASVLRAAHASGDDATDDAALVEAAGGTVVVVAGEPAQPQDHDPRRPPRRRRPAGCPVTIRVGLGYDVHPFVADGDAEHRTLVLAGVTTRGPRPRRPLRRRRRRPRGGRRAARTRRPARPRHALPRVRRAVPRRLVARAAAPRVQPVSPSPVGRWSTSTSSSPPRNPASRPTSTPWPATSWPSSAPTPSCRSSRSAARASARSDAAEGIAVWAVALLERP